MLILDSEHPHSAVEIAYKSLCRDPCWRDRISFDPRICPDASRRDFLHPGNPNNGLGTSNWQNRGTNRARRLSRQIQTAQNSGRKTQCYA